MIHIIVSEHILLLICDKKKVFVRILTDRFGFGDTMILIVIGTTLESVRK